MANVLTIYKLVPNDSEFAYERFIETIITKICSKHEIEYIKYDKEPLAYGMYAMLLYVKNHDSEEGADALNAFQEELEQLEDLQTVELQQQTLSDY
jgi:translation elongation factor EF-1beta